MGMWWLSGDVVVQRGCGGSVGMWWLSVDVVAQSGMWWLSWGCGGSMGMWWLSWLRQLGYIRLLRSSSVFDPGFPQPHSLLRGGRIYGCV
jgi:hypothetical protein